MYWYALGNGERSAVRRALQTELRGRCPCAHDGVERPEC